MGFGNFWQGMMASPVGQFVKRVDEGFANRAIAGEAAARSAGLRRNREALGVMDESQLMKRLTSEARMSDVDARTAAQGFIRSRNAAPSGAGTNVLADQLASQLNRGFGSNGGRIGRMGLMERLSHQAATNRYVRRVAYPALAAGGTVAGGAALTAGAQQLMALMGYMNESQQTAQRTEESPLIQQG